MLCVLINTLQFVNMQWYKCSSAGPINGDEIRCSEAIVQHNQMLSSWHHRQLPPLLHLLLLPPLPQ